MPLQNVTVARDFFLGLYDWISASLSWAFRIFVAYPVILLVLFVAFFEHFSASEFAQDVIAIARTYPVSAEGLVTINKCNDVINHNTPTRMSNSTIVCKDLISEQIDAEKLIVSEIQLAYWLLVGVAYGFFVMMGGSAFPCVSIRKNVISPTTTQIKSATGPTHD